MESVPPINRTLKWFQPADPEGWVKIPSCLGFSPFFYGNAKKGCRRWKWSYQCHIYCHIDFLHVMRQPWSSYEEFCCWNCHRNLSLEMFYNHLTVLPYWNGWWLYNKGIILDYPNVVIFPVLILPSSLSIYPVDPNFAIMNCYDLPRCFWRLVMMFSLSFRDVASDLNSPSFHGCCDWFGTVTVYNSLCIQTLLRRYG